MKTIASWGIKGVMCAWTWTKLSCKQRIFEMTLMRKARDKACAAIFSQVFRLVFVQFSLCRVQPPYAVVYDWFKKKKRKKKKTPATHSTRQMQNQNQSRLGYVLFPALEAGYMYSTSDWFILLFTFSATDHCVRFGYRPMTSRKTNVF